MNYKEFGKLIKVLRKEQVDPVAAKSWTQKMLADKLNVSLRTVEEVERGTKGNLNPQLLMGVAKVFKLTSMERIKLLGLATSMDESSMVAHTVSAEQMQQYVHTFVCGIQLPFVVYDPLYNMVLCNQPFLQFHGVTEGFLDHASTDPARFNILRFFFAPDSPYLTIRKTIPEEHILSSLQYFRGLSFEHRHAAVYASLLSALHRYPGFSKYWEMIKHEERELFFRWQGEEFQHSILGAVSYIVTTTIVLAMPYNLYLSIYVPKSKATQQIFTELSFESHESIQHFAHFPNPKMTSSRFM